MVRGLLLRPRNMRRVLQVVTTVAALAATGGSVRAQMSQPVPPPGPDESGRMVGAYLLGAAAGVASAVLAARGSSPVLLLVSPIAVGGIVCEIGRGGAYEGSCRASLAGAYLGGIAAALIVGALVYASCQEPQDAGTWSLSGCGFYAVAGGALGGLIGAPLGAVIGFNRSKTPRAIQAPVLVPYQPPPSMTSPVVPGPRAMLGSTGPERARQIMIRLAAFSF